MKMDDFDIDARKIKQLLLKVYRDYKVGELSESQAFKETSMLNSILRAVEVADLEARLNRIEGLLR